MNIRKPLLIAGVASSVALASIAGVVSAQSASTTGSSNLITKIAQKFNLKEADVKAVFDEDKTAREAEHQKTFEDRLTQAVTDGKITADQKTKIIAKVKELQAARDANHAAMATKTETERKNAMDAERTAIDKWATDNGIPTEYLHFGGMGGHGGHGPMGGMQTTN